MWLWVARLHPHLEGGRLAWAAAGRARSVPHPVSFEAFGSQWLQQMAAAQIAAGFDKVCFSCLYFTWCIMALFCPIYICCICGRAVGRKRDGDSDCVWPSCGSLSRSGIRPHACFPSKEIGLTPACCLEERSLHLAFTWGREAPCLEEPLSLRPLSSQHAHCLLSPTTISSDSHRANLAPAPLPSSAPHSRPACSTASGGGHQQQPPRGRNQSKWRQSN